MDSTEPGATALTSSDEHQLNHPTSDLVNDQEAKVTHLVVCIITYLRPEGLDRLLKAMDELHRPEGIKVSTVVVDNDPEGSAAWAADRSVLGSVVAYHPEPVRGISFARNRALTEAKALDADWIGWLDDDEAPRPNWLSSIVATQRQTGADVVVGPSEPVFPSDAPAWIVDSGAFDRERFSSRAPMPFFHARTSGVIHRASLTPSEGFDERLALTGGEDRLFFTRMHRAGATFTWDDEAIVDEWLPSSRLTSEWLARRWFRTGVTRSLTLLYIDNPPWSRRLRRVAGGALMAAIGLAETIRALPQGRTTAFLASRKVLLGLGASWGAVGSDYQEYREVHGS